MTRVDPRTGREAPIGDAATIGTVGPLRRIMHRLERSSALDGIADRFGHATDRLEFRPGLRDRLLGDGLGHALHPLLTDFPLGMWMSANYLDVFGGRRARRAAAGLIAGGLLAAIPTAASGVAEWRRSAGGARRVGVAHAAVNGSGTLMYAASLGLRLAGRHRAAVAVGLAAGVTVTAGGYLGGHLSLVHRLGAADPSLIPGPPAGAPPPQEYLSGRSDGPGPRAYRATASGGSTGSAVRVTSYRLITSPYGSTKL